LQLYLALNQAIYSKIIDLKALRCKDTRHFADVPSAVVKYMCVCVIYCVMV